MLDADGEIDYLAELNIGAELTEENVRRLLRWKDPHQLTHRILTGPNAGQLNPRVTRALEAIGQINAFRQGRIAEDAIRHTVTGIFPNGVVFQVFLLHIAKPHAYPIADQHVFRAYSVHSGTEPEATWLTYDGYKQYFSRIAQATNIPEVVDNVGDLKRIDNALMSFGQFLKAYYRP